MTHDELLAYIKEEIEVCEPDCHSHDAENQPWLALRAVVELHKPLNSLWYKQIICESCQEGNDYPITYPCPTIEAIKEQIK